MLSPFTVCFLADNKKQGVQSPEGMKFPDFSRPRLNSYECPRLLGGGVSGILSQKSFKIKMLRLAENEFHTKNSLTFSPSIEIP